MYGRPAVSTPFDEARDIRVRELRENRLFAPKAAFGVVGQLARAQDLERDFLRAGSRRTLGAEHGRRPSFADHFVNRERADAPALQVAEHD